MTQVIHSTRTEAQRGSRISKRRQCSVAVVMAENRNRFSAIARVTYACSLAMQFTIICCVPAQLSHDLCGSNMSSLLLFLEHVVES